MKVICPECKQNIDKNNFNIATDIAYCPDCDKKFALSSLVGDEEIDTSISYEPPRGTFLNENYDGSFSVGAKMPKAILLFLVPFFCLWSGMSMYGIYIKPLMEKGHLEMTEALFGLPFLFGTVVLLAIITTIAFGCLKVTADSYEGKVFLGVFGIGRTRTFSVPDIQNVTLTKTDVRVNNVRQLGITLHGKNDLTFGTLLKEPHKKYIAAVLKQRLVR